MRASGEDFVLLDVREQDEYDFAKIDGSMLIAMSELGDRLADLEPYRDSHIVVHCHHGGRSLRVTQVLREQGFSKVQNMTGGIDAWSQQIDSNVQRY
ncbi:rhodanese-like domain-containing protein [Rubripirellula amarantea]|nr:rhodanese-like domain-containing protein [Rubripirellula amarantea]